MELERRVTFLLAFVFGVVAIFAGIAWYNNIWIALQWQPIIGKEYRGPIPWFDWAAVDFSTITTFIPFCGFVLIVIGLLKTALGSRVSEYFPFFRWHNSLTIALGLIGTVWGLIMIGYYDPDVVTMRELVYCLRTALYSTLVALLWVFLFALPIGHVMRWWHWKVVGVRVDESGISVISYIRDLEKAISDVVPKISNASSEFSAVAKQAGEASKVLDEFKKRAGVDAAEALRNACNALESSCNKIAGTLTSINAESQERQEIMGKQLEVLEKQLKVVESQENFLRQISNELVSEKQARRKAEQRASLAESLLCKVREALKG